MALYKKLYWCYALHEHRRYAIVADSAYRARRQFANEHGYYAVDIVASRICRLPVQHQQTNQVHPDDNLLVDCGVEFITKLHRGDKVSQVIKRMLKPGGRIFKVGNRIYQEDL
jgi:hypothetical protein